MNPSFRKPFVSLILSLLVALPVCAAPEETPKGLEPEIENRVAPPVTAPETIRVVSFNVHHGDDIPGLARSIQAHPGLCTAHVFLLQEIESYPAEGASRARKLAEALGMNYVYAPARFKEKVPGTHGLAILSRFPLRDIEVIPLKRYKLGVNTRRRIALGATLELGGRRLRLYNVHLDTRINARERIEQLQPIVEAAKRQSIGEAVIGGDFNTNPFYWLLPLLPVFRSNQAKAVDDYMKQHQFETPFAQSGGTVKKWMGKFRVDTVYSRGLRAGAYGVEDGVRISDHFPLWVDLTLPAAPR